MVADTVTDANGFFKFECVKQGVYSLRFYDIPNGFQFSPMDVGSDDTIDNDANVSGETAFAEGATHSMCGPVPLLHLRLYKKGKKRGSYVQRGVEAKPSLSQTTKK